MIIQRPECIKSTSSVEELQAASNKNFSYKMQQQHIKRLLSTAATATGIVGDVDALPAPPNTTQKAERNLWRLEEIREVLNIMQQINALELLNDKTIKSEKVFRNIEQMMHRKGFRKKSHSQIWTKWKFLKSTYMTSRRNRIVPKMIPYEIYQILHKMLSSSFGMNNGNSSTASLDGDTSNCEDNSLTNGVTSSVKPDRNELAHPIFGFRLGLVKSEPVDTGYETTANNSIISETDSFEASAAFAPAFSPTNSTSHTTQNSFLDIKEERVTDSPTPSSLHSEVVENSLLAPMNSVLIPTSVVSSNALMKNSVPASTETSLPPLRIAPFANERNMKEAFLRLDQTPPPLSLHSTTVNTPQQITEKDGSTFIRKTLRSSEHVDSTSVNTSVNKSTTRPSVLRLPKELTLQLRAADSDAGLPRLKQVPMRQTAYSLRPDRSIPDLSDVYATATNQNQKSPSHTSKSSKPHSKLEIPMTSQMASQVNTIGRTTSLPHLKQKKRRLQVPAWGVSEKVHPTKITRSSSHVLPEIHKEENIDNSFTDFQDSGKPQTSSSNDPTSCSNPKHKNHSTVEQMLKELAVSLRQTQIEMINNFFDNQMEIAREEHEFQMKQDQLVMEAFQEQTRQLMRSAKKVFGIHLKPTYNNFENGTEKNDSYETTSSKNKNIQEVLLHSASVGESKFSSSNEVMDNGHDNENVDTTVDPIQFVTSELVESYEKL